MALSTIMGTSYACLGAVRTLEDVGKRMGADLLLNFRELRQCEVRRTPLPSTRVYGALSCTGSSPIHRRVVNFIGPGRGRMGRTDQGLLRRIVLREALAARLAESCSIGRGICGATSEDSPSTHSGEWGIWCCESGRMPRLEVCCHSDAIRLRRPSLLPAWRHAYAGQLMARSESPNVGPTLVSRCAAHLGRPYSPGCTRTTPVSGQTAAPTVVSGLSVRGASNSVVCRSGLKRTVIRQASSAIT